MDTHDSSAPCVLYYFGFIQREHLMSCLLGVRALANEGMLLMTVSIPIARLHDRLDMKGKNFRHW